MAFDQRIMELERATVMKMEEWQMRQGGEALVGHGGQDKGFMQELEM